MWNRDFANRRSPWAAFEEPVYLERVSHYLGLGARSGWEVSWNLVRGPGQAPTGGCVARLDTVAHHFCEVRAATKRAPPDLSGM